jgi:hypothetical protein
MNTTPQGQGWWSSANVRHRSPAAACRREIDALVAEIFAIPPGTVARVAAALEQAGKLPV